MFSLNHVPFPPICLVMVLSLEHSNSRCWRLKRSRRTTCTRWGERQSERSGSQKCIAHTRRPHVRWVWLTLAPDPPHRIPVGGLGPGGQRHCTSWISPGPLLYYYYWSTYLPRFLFSQVCAIHVTSRSPAISSHKESESRKTVISRISKGGRFCYYYLHGSFISCAISLKTNHPILSSRTIHGVGTSARSRAHAS
jgi:hypothetical protein